MTDLLSVLEREAWLEYAAVADPAGDVYQEALMCAWERATSAEELEQIVSGPERAYRAVERPAWARYCATIGRPLDVHERESVRLASEPTA